MPDPHRMFPACRFAIVGKLDTALPSANCNLMNKELFLTALSNRYLETAEGWKDLGRQPTYCETDMIDLAGHCEGLINGANREGYLSSVVRCLIEATDWNEAEVENIGDNFTFYFFGGDFFSLAGSTTQWKPKALTFAIHKESLIIDFINQANLDELPDKASVLEAFFGFARGEQQREAGELIVEENLNAEAAKRYISTSLKREFASENGTELNSIMPKMSQLNPQSLTKKQTVLQRITAFVEKFKGVGGEV